MAQGRNSMINNVYLEYPNEPKGGYEQGDIFELKDNVYILSIVRVDENFTHWWQAVNLVDGNRFREMTDDIDMAVAGLNFIGRGADIKIMFKGSNYEK